MALALGMATLVLTKVERNLKELLLDVAKFTNPDKPSELRFTGGWVRDKLLGVDSHDIDVAINDMTGFQFGMKMNEYLLLPGNLEKHGLGDSPGAKRAEGVGSPYQLHKIAANPDKSKHLETVTTKILGLDVDLVNLRKEVYSEDSRTPQMEFGEPTEDALRRDATINAMFYNLQTGQLEDLTGQGIDDMLNKIIRTPLDPYQTFKDDPLRVLRLIRFASRLNYSIDPVAKKSMKDPAIQEALKLKISRERVGVEVEKMLKGPSPRLALSLIQELGLYNTIFEDPTTTNSFTPETELLTSSFDFTQAFLNATEHTSRQKLVLDVHDEYLTWMLSAFVPFADAPTPEMVKGKISPPLAAIAAKEGLKLNKKTFDVIGASVKNFEELITIKDKFVRRSQITNSEVDPAGRGTLGMAIRRMGPTWRNQAFYAILLDHAHSTRDVLSEWDSFILHLDSLRILDAYEFKPIMDGTQLASALKARPGPWMKDALDVLMTWQLQHPQNENIDDAIQAVQEHQQKEGLSKAQGELVADLVHHFLTLTIRPLFAKTAQAHADTVTAQGRKVDRTKEWGPMPRKYDEVEDEKLTRPWKDAKDSHALSLLQWIVTHLTPSLTERNWPLLIPPILTLLDDIDTKYKARGCKLLQSLLEATPPSLLKRTGLADVFEEALKPSLSYLPTLTPEPESINILDAAYPAILALVAVRHSPSAFQPSKTSKSRTATPQRPEPFSAKSFTLISLLHTHIFPSLTHISPPSTYPALNAALLMHMQSVIGALGLDTIAQLIHLVPLLNEILTSPFAATTSRNMRMTLAAIKTLQMIVANSWPRMIRWRAEVLQSVISPWIALAQEGVMDEEQQAVAEDIKAASRVCTNMLLRAVEAVVASGDDKSREENEDEDHGEENIAIVDFRGELKQLIEADARLEELFGPMIAADDEPSS